MATGKRRLPPGFYFYAGDWIAEPTLKPCSLAARGLWADILALIASFHSGGYLEMNGKQIGTSELAQRIGITEEKVAAALKELKDNGVCSVRKDGTIYSRRMVHDLKLSTARANAGSKGGKAKDAARGEAYQKKLADYIAEQEKKHGQEGQLETLGIKQMHIGLTTGQIPRRDIEIVNLVERILLGQVTRAIHRESQRVYTAQASAFQAIVRLEREGRVAAISTAKQVRAYEWSGPGEQEKPGKEDDNESAAEH